VSVLNAFLSTWSGARSTFGEGAPETGARYDQSASLRGMQSNVESAAPSSTWTGSAAGAYGTANTNHGDVFGRLAGLDRRLGAQVDQSSQVVDAGRRNLDSVRRWVIDAAASLPPGKNREQMLLPIVQKGLGQLSEIVTTSHGDLDEIAGRIRGIGAEYDELGEQEFAPRAGAGEDPGERLENEYEKALRDAGLLTGPPQDGYYKEWLENAKRQGVPPSVIVDIARRHDITPEDFDVLNGMEKITDRDGKSFFLMPPGTGGDDARKAALMTYILNAGTDYGDATGKKDFTETPYSSIEIARISDRQAANSWSYDRDLAFVDGNGGRLATTPNGMLMGLGGNGLQDLYSEGGGTTWGDIFMTNIDDPDDPAQQLRQIVESGDMWYPAPDGNGRQGSLDLDRLLHHEECHSQQWAEKGYTTMLKEYGLEWLREKAGYPNRLEEDAGPSDGGYR
jgi:hypothetical protein